MESKGGPAGVFPHIKHKPSSIHISQQSQESTTGGTAAATTTTLQAPLTPRIDISRASSSSYHEDSSPENVFDQVWKNICFGSFHFICVLSVPFIFLLLLFLYNLVTK